jgi:PAS domain S-box-containing protein
MAEKPSYRQLEKKVKELEAEVERLRGESNACAKRQLLVREAEQMALLGHWELDLVTGTLYWSDEIYRIFGLTPGEFGATYEAFLETVHPDDREFVDNAYTSSVEDQTGYDIVHRLLLSDGTIKYVHEKCKTEYGPDEKPLRSVGTVQDITERMRAKNSFAGIVGRHPLMQDVFKAIRELADVKMPVVISGESGTGKELVARALHSQGPRATKPFVPVNCGALPENLLESELFGHVRGAFTGAIRDKKGRFELADGGTLFLDEIAEMPKSLQVKLLRVLQEEQFERVGDEKTILVDVRLISATNRDLERETKRGNFREDLYYRVKVVPIALPPLRERRSDIPLLVDHFLEQAVREGQRAGGISKNAVTALTEYEWPGNVRELQSAVHFALVKSWGQKIQRAHLPAEIRSLGGGADSEPAPVKPAGKPGRRKLDERSVGEALERAHGNKVKAAKLLGVGRATLYRFLKNHALP